METILSINASYPASTSTSTSIIEPTLNPRVSTLHEEIILDTLHTKDMDARESIEMPYLPSSSASSSRPIVSNTEEQPPGMGTIPLGLSHGLGVDLENIPSAAAIIDPTKAPVAATAIALAPGDLVQSKTQRRIARIQFVSICYAIFVCGWNDGSTGALLPRIQKVYHVDFVVVSLLFVLSCVGSISGGLSNVHLTNQLGFGKVVVLGNTECSTITSSLLNPRPLAALCQVIAYTIMSTGPPFPLFVLSFTINGFGMAINEAQGNSFIVNMANNDSSSMGLLHASYGLGALLSPLVATQFASARHWSFHYLCSLGFALSNTLFLIAAFRLRTTEECMRDVGLTIANQETPAPGNNENKFRQILGMKSVHILAFFAFVYVGLEVTIGGWIVSFLIDVRHGGPSSGYVSAGFFGGLMLGRVLLLWVTKVVGEQRVLYLYSFIVMGLEFIIWFVPSIVGDAVAVSLAGLFLGPIFPIVMNLTGRVLPRRVLIGSIGWISSFGAVGSAALPFMTGALANKAGIKSLQPLLISMLVVMIVLWSFAPRKHVHMHID